MVPSAIVAFAGGSPSKPSPRSREKIAISNAPMAVGSSTTRPAESQEARPEPTPMATAKTAI
jgi:hypothetical protein